MDPDHLAALWQTEDPVVGGGSAPSAPQTSAEQRRVFFSLLLASPKAHSTNAGLVCGLERGLAAKPTGMPRCHGGAGGCLLLLLGEVLCWWRNVSGGCDHSTLLLVDTRVPSGASALTSSKGKIIKK